MISNLSAQQESSICSAQVSEPEFCLATTEKDFAQIRALNYQTFVEEIPQHEKNETGLLRDRFEDESLYVICRQRNEVVGMLALRAHRPFSLDSKLNDLDRLSARALLRLRNSVAVDQAVTPPFPDSGRAVP